MAKDVTGPRVRIERLRIPAGARDRLEAVLAQRLSGIGVAPERTARPIAAAVRARIAATRPRGSGGVR